MKWNEYDIRLRTLYNAISGSFSETVSATTSQRLEDEAAEIMEELTNLLKDKQ
ncbi:hypothetical protein [Clostridium estertheticum]|uniref:hypothetical protein n=1 Tax=Clostridium estertheticum TaxID=238834 RepID=UPI001C0B6864|nr:hypothetical protein [Clostridium estertheticum]MBU3186588.1 hypothetical protein [Clostridium estertheticum]